MAAEKDSSGLTRLNKMDMNREHLTWQQRRIVVVKVEQD